MAETQSIDDSSRSTIASPSNASLHDTTTSPSHPSQSYPLSPLPKDKEKGSESSHNPRPQSSHSHSAGTQLADFENAHPGIRQTLHDFVHPAGVKNKHKPIVKWLGRIGFVAKGCVYGIIGGMTCASAARLTLPGTADDDASPQGVFIFIGGFPAGTPLLVAMFVGVLFYAIWRFWETCTGQGSDAQFSAKTNFFRYRLSPFVSGCVYTAYLYYIFKLIPESSTARSQTTSPGCFPSCWRDTAAGRMGLVVFGFAFCIATITQLINVVTIGWHRDLCVRHSSKFVMYGMYILGHLGFLARAGVFLFVAVLMFRALATPVDSSHSTVANALNLLLPTKGGQVTLFAVGLGLIVYGLFAVLNSVYKYFPTPPPSRRQDGEHTEEEEQSFGLRAFKKWAGFRNKVISPWLEEGERAVVEKGKRRERNSGGQGAQPGYFDFKPRNVNGWWTWGMRSKQEGQEGHETLPV